MLTDLGLPDFLEKIDDIFVWDKNGKTYIFYQNLYWKYDEDKKQMEDGYPKVTILPMTFNNFDQFFQDISKWDGIPQNIDAVMNSPFDGKTYFFKGSQFWRFNDENVSAENPRKIGGFWVKDC